MATYTVQDTTMTALGDAIRSKVIGQSELPLPISKENVSGNPYNLEVIEFPSFVKTVIVTGRVYDVDISNLNPQGILHNLAYASGVYTRELDLRAASDFTVINPNWAGVGYDFEITVKSNALTFTTEKGYNSWQQTFVYDYTAIGLDENGNEFKYTPLEMVDKINNLMTIPDEGLTITGSCAYRFANNGWNWFIETAGDKITTKDISNATYMFDSLELEYIPFDINFNNNTTNHLGNMFYKCYKLKTIPMINGARVAGSSNSIFSSCYNIRYFPEHFAEDWDFTDVNNYQYGGMAYLFDSCYSLRKIPTALLNNFHNKATAYYSNSYYQAFYICVSLDDINGIGISGANLTSNVFQQTFNLCCRVSNITFLVNNDGTPKTANWKGQTIDLSVGGWTNTTYKPYILNYNSGITADKEVKDDATYQALKDDPDWFTLDVNYSRYNHDSAVNTINSLPDTSAYLASSGGTNTIKFMGAAGTLTDGGAINTLTEEEIAVASAKGWTVSLV